MSRRWATRSTLASDLARRAVSELIDTTEMYLRTIFELIEEGIPPLRARIAERLGHSGPTVSQTVARMERDGLLVVTPDRQIELTDTGFSLAARVTRKHRLAERLLMDVIGLDWELIHDEACRWEHVVSEAVERRLVTILDGPTHSPYGNPIPALEELGSNSPVGTASRWSVGTDCVGRKNLVVAHFSEHAQTDADLLARLSSAGVMPGSSVEVAREPGGFRLVTDVGSCVLPSDVAALVFVAEGE
jgi:DtxR family Mn-dependent transcriptional regulator